MTYLSPAFSAILLACSNTRASSGARYTCPAPPPDTFGRLASDAFGLGQRLLRSPAGLADQAGGQPFLVVEQHLEQMLRRELLVALAQREALRRLDEALGAIGIFVEVHVPSPPAVPEPRSDPGVP